MDELTYESSIWLSMKSLAQILTLTAESYKTQLFFFFLFFFSFYKIKKKKHLAYLKIINNIPNRHQLVLYFMESWNRTQIIKKMV